MKVLMSKPRTSWAVSIGWMVLSVSTAAVLLTTFNTSVWFYRKNNIPDDTKEIKETVTFGLVGYCRQITIDKVNDGNVCQNYGGGQVFHFANIPDPWWKISYVLFGCGSVFFGYSAVCAIICQVLPNISLRKSVSHYTGYVQAVGVLLLALALIAFPAGLGNEFDQKICGPDITGPFKPNECQVGWTFALAIMTTVVAIYCPYLSRYTYYFEYELELMSAI